MKLIKNAQVFSPSPLGQKDVLIAANKIIAIEDDLSHMAIEFTEVIDASGQILTPGFVDSLVLITGGGGEGGVPSIFSKTQIPRTTGEVSTPFDVRVRILPCPNKPPRRESAANFTLRKCSPFTPVIL